MIWEAFEKHLHGINQTQMLNMEKKNDSRANFHALDDINKFFKQFGEHQSYNITHLCFHWGKLQKHAMHINKVSSHTLLTNFELSHKTFTS